MVNLRSLVVGMHPGRPQGAAQPDECERLRTFGAEDFELIPRAGVIPLEDSGTELNVPVRLPRTGMRKFSVEMPTPQMSSIIHLLMAGVPASFDPVRPAPVSGLPERPRGRIRGR